jgi:hypothetical protein
MSAAWKGNSSQNGQEAGNDYRERQKEADRKPAPPVFEKNVSFRIDAHIAHIAHILAPLSIGSFDVSAGPQRRTRLFTW